MSQTPSQPAVPAVQAKEIVLAEDIFVTKDGQPRYWTLYFRRGNIFQTKSFQFDGTLNQACLRARRHCEVMNYRYQYVRPLVVDLDYQENMYMQGRFKDADVPEQFT